MLTMSSYAFAKRFISFLSRVRQHFGQITFPFRILGFRVRFPHREQIFIEALYAAMPQLRPNKSLWHNQPPLSSSGSGVDPRPSEYTGRMDSPYCRRNTTGIHCIRSILTVHPRSSHWLENAHIYKLDNDNPARRVDRLELPPWAYPEGQLSSPPGYSWRST